MAFNSRRWLSKITEIPRGCQRVFGGCEQSTGKLGQRLNIYFLTGISNCGGKMSCRYLFNPVTAQIHQYLITEKNKHWSEVFFELVVRRPGKE